MDNEIKIVTRQETFTDLAVRELAKGRAACLCRIQFKRCTKGWCKTCSCARQFNNCVSAMSEYDRLRLDSYIAEYYVRYSRNAEQWLSHRGFIIYYAKFCAAILFGSLAFVVFAAAVLGMMS